MTDEPTILSRDTLYKQVWETPIHRLAKEYGLSDVGLAKICKRLNVPRPGRGFWVRRQKGWPVKIPPLPPLKHGQIDKVRIEKKASPPTLESDNSPIAALIARERLPENHIVVSEMLTAPHPLVKETKKILKGTKPDDYGRVWSTQESCLDIRVGAQSLDRALRIMDAIIKSLEKRGYEVTARSRNNQDTAAIVLGEKVCLGIEEGSHRRERELTSQEKKDRERWPNLYTTTPYIYVPSGMLSLKIKVWGCGTLRKQWSDGTKQRLEDRLNDFVMGLLRVSEGLTAARLEREERERRWEEEKRRREEQERQRKEEEERIRILENTVSNWQKSQQVRSFITAFREAAIAKHGYIEHGSELDKWLQWASDYADRIDPLKG
jgi:hypothetical protein